MRRLILSALVLLPVLASAQTSTSTAAASSATSNTLIASATPPAPLPAAAAAAKPAARDAADIMVPVNQIVVDNGKDPDSLGPIYVGPNTATVPVLIHAVPVSLSLKDVRTEGAAADATVVVTVSVDARGVPNSPVVAHSAGAALDQRALAAISQYRFAPATQSGLPVNSQATIKIEFKTR